MELKGCAAIVTGGSGGLGQRICRALALQGVDIVVNYAESETKAKSVAADMIKLGVRSIALRADVTDPQAVKRMVDETQADSGESTYSSTMPRSTRRSRSRISTA